MSPPDQSKIRTETVIGYDKIVAPQSNGGLVRYLIGALMLACLAGWTYGLVMALNALLGIHASLATNGFLIFWTAAGAVGVSLTIGLLFALFRPSIPEGYTLTVPTLTYNSGRPPFGVVAKRRSQAGGRRKPFQKRSSLEFSSEELRTLRLRNAGSRSRMTIEKENTSIELAKALSNREKEWLHRILTQEYGLDQQPD